MSARSPSVSAIIPALNEQDNIRDAVSELTHYLDRRQVEHELLLFDDGSTDATGAIMDALAQENPRVVVTHNRPSRNVGGVYKQGVAMAQGEYVFLFPGDNENPAHTLDPLFDALGSADVIIPYPTNAGSVRPLHRRALSGTYTRLINTLFRLQLTYYNGTSMFRTEHLRAIEIQADSSVYQAEILVKLLRADRSYREVPVQLGEGNGSQSKALRARNVAGVAAQLVRLLDNVYRSGG